MWHPTKNRVRLTIKLDSYHIWPLSSFSQSFDRGKIPLWWKEDPILIVSLSDKSLSGLWQTMQSSSNNFHPLATQAQARLRSCWLGSQFGGIDIILLPYYSDLHNDSKIPLYHHYTAFIGITSPVPIGDSVAKHKNRKIGLKKEICQTTLFKTVSICLHSDLDQAASWVGAPDL